MIHFVLITAPHERHCQSCYDPCDGTFHIKHGHTDDNASVGTGEAERKKQRSSI
jgi:hypothetical protein